MSIVSTEPQVSAEISSDPKIQCFQIYELLYNQKKLTFPHTAFHNYNITLEVCKWRERLHDQMVLLTFLPMQLSN